MGHESLEALLKHSPLMQPEDWARFIELPSFLRRWGRLDLSDDDLRALQIAIMVDPTRAPVVPGAGGVRKMRFSSPQWPRGKSGGVRVCYVWFEEFSIAVLMTVYGKGEKGDLTMDEKNAIGKLIRRLKEQLSGGEIL